MVTKKKKGTENGSKRRRKSDDSADWRAADYDLLSRAVSTIAHQGGALRLGYTTDGGAYSIGIYGDGDAYTEYVRPSEDIDDYLRDLVERWDE